MTARDPDKRVLLIDDSQDDILLALRVLKSVPTESRYEVQTAMDGAEALQVLFEEDTDNYDFEVNVPSLILLDISLPRIDGIEVLRRIRANERTRCIPVVIFSSSDSLDDIETSYEYGANSYLKKPALYKEYKAVLEQVSWYWLDSNLCF